MGLTRRHRGGSGFRSGFTEAAHAAKQSGKGGHTGSKLSPSAGTQGATDAHKPKAKSGGGAGVGMLALPWGMVALDRWAGKKYGKKKGRKSRKSRGGARHRRRRTHRRRTHRRRTHRRRTHHRRRR